MREEILRIMERDGRVSFGDIGKMVGVGERVIAKEVEAMIADGVICGFGTLINWDKAGDERVTALIEVKVTPSRGQGYNKIAERIYNFDEVSAVYLMSGGFDLTVIIEGKTMKDVAYFVHEKLAPLESVVSTATHFVLKKYKDWNVVLEKGTADDARMAVTP